jgi:dihydroorotase
MKHDWLIQHGRVIDPANGIDALRDISLAGGKIAAVAEKIDAASAERVFDASGMIVVPGLVDLHVHGYHHATPLGVDPDHYFLGRGVTTAVDAGSAGNDTFAGLREFVMKRCQTRLLAMLHISSCGLSFSGLGGDDDVPGELDLIRLADVDRCVRCIEVNRDVVVGVKVRLSDSIADNGRNEHEAYARAKNAARRAGLPLMVHHNFSTVSMVDCPGKMAAGDIYTHTYHGFPSCVINPTTRQLEPSVIAARKNGVLFDMGHGAGSFDWTVAELAAKAAFWPDTISTDLHKESYEGPAYDLPTVRSRLLHLGMPVNDVIAASTINPARAIGWADRIGTLGIGRGADVAVLKLEDVNFELEDAGAQLRTMKRLLVARAVWRDGRPSQITRPRSIPNPEVIQSRKAWRERLVVRD